MCDRDVHMWLLQMNLQVGKVGKCAPNLSLVLSELEIKPLICFGDSDFRNSWALLASLNLWDLNSTVSPLASLGSRTR